MNTIITRCLLSTYLLAFSLLPLPAQLVELQRLPGFITTLVFRGDELWYTDEVSLIKRDRLSGELLQKFDPQPGFEGYFDVSLDGAGNLWLAVGDGGIARFDGASQWQVWNAQNTPVFPEDLPLLNVFVNSANEVWAYGYDGASSRYFFFDGGAWQEETALANRLYRKFLNGPQNEFILCARDTLLIRNNNTWKSIPEPEEGPDNRLNAPVFDPQGRLWITTNYSRIYRYDDLGQAPSAPAVDELATVNDMVIDPAGTLYVGTTNHRLARWTGQFWDVLPSVANTQSPLPANVYKLQVDPDGRMWIGQNLITNPIIQMLTLHENQAPVKNFYSGVTGARLIKADGAGNMWFGLSPVLTRQNAADGSLDFFELFDYNSDVFKKLVAGVNDDLWLLTSEFRVLHFDGVQWQPFVSDKLPQYLFDMTVDGNGLMYFNGFWPPWFQDKIVIFNPADSSWTTETGVGNAVINSSEVEADEAGNVWFGTDQGLGKRAADGTLAVFPTPGASQWPYAWLEIGIGPSGKVYVVDRSTAGKAVFYQFDANTSAWTPIPWPDSTLAGFINPDNLSLSWWHADGHGRIWMASGNRCWVREAGIWTEIAQPLPFGFYTFGSAPDGQVYFGFFEYLGRFKSSGRIEGPLLKDADQNCIPSAPDKPLAGFLMVAEGNGQQYAGLSRPDGSYRIYTPPGSMTVNAVLPGNLWQACLTGGATVQVQKDSVVALDFLLEALADCPRMSVDLSAAFLRRCFENSYSAKVCNSGTAEAENAAVEITLPAEMSLVSAGLPYTEVVPRVFRFELGNVGAGECVEFAVTVYITCENTAIGQTLCVQAQVYPDTLCAPPSAWNGASVVLDAACDGDSVRFTLKNTGTTATSQPLPYRLLRNLTVEESGTFTLQNGTARYFSRPATGDTWRLMADQEPGHPFAPLAPSLAVEGCVAAGGTFETGHVTAFANSSGSGFSDRQCQELIGSFDPNDKTALPKGAGDDAHNILPGTALDYTIRFQNTGTDTAFTVVVRDTLDRLLDLTTFQLGVSSHPYRVDINGRALAFVFENILLPDSNVNLAGSQGFVTFRIRPRTDIPLGSMVQNAAAIYFDFNEPVLTNTVWHIVDENFFPTVSAHAPETGGRSQLLVFPNPAQDRFWVKTPFPAGTLEMFDLQGRLLQRVQVNGGVPVLLECSDCPSGLYTLRFTGNEKVVGGKVVKR